MVTKRTTNPDFIGLLPSVGHVSRILFSTAFLLVCVSLLGMYIRFTISDLHPYIYHLMDRVSVDGELNVTAFFSTLLLLISSALLWLERSIEKGSSRQRQRWLGLALIFFALAMDEAISLHELLNLFKMQSIAPSSKLLHWTWVIPGMIFVTLVFIFYLPFLQRLPRRTAGLMVLAGGLYVGGAIGVEMIGASFAADHGVFSLTYNLIAHLEELLEMCGLITFIYSLLDHLNSQIDQIVLVFKPNN